MPRPRAAIVVSPSGLFRDLIVDWLRLRYGTRVVAVCTSPEECLPPFPAADLVVWDARDFRSGPAETARARLESLYPGIALVILQDEVSTLQEACAALGIVAAPATHEKLTPLETEVLLAVAAGYRNADIARRMRRSSKTVEKHRANLQRKLGLRTVAQLTAYALRMGMLDIEAILQHR